MLTDLILFSTFKNIDSDQKGVWKNEQLKLIKGTKIGIGTKKQKQKFCFFEKSIGYHSQFHGHCLEEEGLF